MKTVCVIVINYFATDKTRDCLESLRGEAIERLRLIDNSADSVEAERCGRMVEEFLDTPVPWRLSFVASDTNTGFGRAINKAVRQDLEETGGHDCYLLMNNDAVGSPDFVSRLVGKMESSPENALVTPKIEWSDDEVCLNWYQPLTGHLRNYRLPWAFPYATGCCLLVDRRMVDEAGNLFDEDFFMYGEDVLLNWRAHQAGYRVVCAEDVQVLHEGTGSSRHGGLFFEYHVSRGHVLLADKLASGVGKRVLYRLGRFCYLALRCVVRGRRYASWDPVKAFFMAWRVRQVRVK